MNLPPVWRAYSQLNRAVRTLPMWGSPVGLGANLTRIFSATMLLLSLVRERIPIQPTLGVAGWVTGLAAD
jgi:hypothetical protein